VQWTRRRSRRKKQKGFLDELDNEIALWDLPFKVLEELCDIQGNEMDAFFVQHEIYFKEAMSHIGHMYLWKEYTFANRRPIIQIMSTIMARWRAMRTFHKLIPSCRAT
jgi:hypothetical protein